MILSDFVKKALNMGAHSNEGGAQTNSSSVAFSALDESRPGKRAAEDAAGAMKKEYIFKPDDDYYINIDLLCEHNKGDIDLFLYILNSIQFHAIFTKLC